MFRFLFSWIFVFIIIVSPVLGFVEPYVRGLPGNTSISGPDSIVKYKKIYFDSWENDVISGGLANLNHTQRETSYEYYLLFNETRFPVNGSFYFSVSGRDPLLKDAAIRLLRDSRSFCEPLSGDFSCHYEDFQAFEILRYSRAARVINGSYADIVINLSTANITSGSYISLGHCDHSYGDFNCETNKNDMQHEVYGGVKQGLLIYSLWNAYSVTGNKTIRELALNYTMGHASDCDVWEEDYSCASNESQGYMTLGYFEAYRNTNNLTYYEKALKLASAEAGALGGLSQLKAYQLTHDEKYLTRAREIISSLDTCGECSSEDIGQLMMLFSEAYLTTGEDQFILSLQDLLSTEPNDCNAFSSNLSCEDPAGQGLYAIGFLDAYLTLPGQPTFTKVKVKNASYNSLMTIDADLYGYLPDPMLHYKNIYSPSWNSVPLDNVSIDTTSLGEGIIEFFFNSSRGIRYPANSLHLVLPHEFETFRRNAQLLSEQDPVHFCGPFGTNKYSNYSCKEEDMQGWMILSRASSFFFHNSSKDIFKDQILEFSQSYIDDNNFSRSTCEFLDSDYVCEDISENLAIDNFCEPGPVRQSMMASSFLSIYADFDKSVKQIPLNYLEHPSSDCFPLKGDFNCSSPEYLALSYWKGYWMTGEPLYYSVAYNLTQRVDNSLMSAISLLKGYEITGSEDFLSKANIILSNFSDLCVNTSCEPEFLGENILAYWEAYRITANMTYAYDGYLKATSLTDGRLEDCNPNSPSYDPLNPETLDSFRCFTPDTQGLLTFAFTKAAQNYFLSSNHSFSVSMSPVENIGYNSNHTVSCSFENTGNVSVKNVYLSLNTLQDVVSIETTGTPFAGHRVLFNEIVPGESLNATWTLNATSGGKQTISCQVEENVVQRSHEVFDIPPTLQFSSSPVSNWHFSDTFTKEYSLLNPYDFKLSNVVLELNASNGLVVEPDKIHFPILYENATFNVTYSAYSPLSSNTTISFAFNYSDGSGYYNESFILYDLFLNTSFNFPSEVSLYDDFSLDFWFDYLESFDAENLSVDLDYPSSLTLVNISVNASVINYSDSDLLVSNMSGSVNWSFLSNVTGNYSLNLNLSAPLYSYKESYGFNLSVLSNAFDVRVSSPLDFFESGVSERFNVTLVLNSTISNELDNVTINTSFTEGLRLLDERVETVNVMSYPNNSELLAKDNLSIEGDSFAFNFSNGDILSVEMFHDSNETVNLWCGSKLIYEMNLSGFSVYNGTFNSSYLVINSTENFSLDYFAIRNNVTVNYTDSTFKHVPPDSNIITQWTFLVNSSSPKENIEFRISSLQGSLDTGSLIINRKKVEDSSSDSPKSASSSSPPPTNSFYPHFKEYSYLSYNISSYLINRSFLYQIVPSTNHNYSKQMASCLSVSRLYRDLETVNLTLNYECENSTSFFIVYDELNGNVYVNLSVNTTDHCTFCNSGRFLYFNRTIKQGDNFSITYSLQNTSETYKAPLDFDFIRPLVFGYPNESVALEIARLNDLHFILSYFDNNESEITNEIDNNSDVDVPTGNSNSSVKTNGTGTIKTGPQNSTLDSGFLNQFIINFYDELRGYILGLVMIILVIGIGFFMYHKNLFEIANTYVGKSLKKLKRKYLKLFGPIIQFFSDSSYILRHYWNDLVYPFFVYSNKKVVNKPDFIGVFLATHEKKLSRDISLIMKYLIHENLSDAYNLIQSVKTRIAKLSKFSKSAKKLEKKLNFVLLLYTHVNYTIRIKELSKSIIKAYLSRRPFNSLKSEQERLEVLRDSVYDQLKNHSMFAYFKTFKNNESTPPSKSIDFTSLDAEFYYLLNELRFYLNENDFDSAKNTLNTLKKVYGQVIESFKYRPEKRRHKILLHIYKDLVNEYNKAA